MTVDPEPPTFEVPIAHDPAFQAASIDACRATGPGDVYDLTSPGRPLVQVPGYEGLHVVVLEMRDRKGRIGPPPDLPSDEDYYPLSSSSADDDALLVRATVASQVDLLACVVLRAGDREDYTIGAETVTVTALDAIAWMVDRRTRELVGGPWVAAAELGFLVNLSDLITVGGATYLPGDIFAGIVRFMGIAGPSPGAFYQGGEDAWVVAEYDKPFDLPPGTRLLPGHTFVIRLVELGDAATIDFIEVLCAPNGRIASSPLRVAAGVRIDLGAFTAASADVRVTGEFSSSTFAAGTIRALTARARDCGVPSSADWQASLSGSARSDGSGGYELYLPQGL
jgi:hypothetical protein